MTPREAVAILDEVRYPLNRRMNNATECALRALRASFWYDPDETLPPIHAPVLILCEGGTVREAWLAPGTVEGRPVFMTPSGYGVKDAIAWRAMPKAEEVNL